MTKLEQSDYTRAQVEAWESNPLAASKAALPSGEIVLLLKAASFASTKVSAKKAIDVAWSALHTGDPHRMRRAFEAWCSSEGMMQFIFGYNTTSLGSILRRRYKTSEEIVNSLKKAAQLRSES